MSFRHNTVSRLIAVCALVTFSFMGVAEAQLYGPGHMMGPGMLDRQQLGRMCSPRAAGFAEWRLDQMERIVKPTDAQRTKFDEFKTVSNKASEMMRAACATDVTTTMVGRMEAMEKRLDVMGSS